MIVAMFRTENGLAHALRRLRGARIGPLETYTPAPLRTIATAVLANPVDHPGRGPVRRRRRELRAASLLSIVAYRFDIGGRPAFAWPSFIADSVRERACLSRLALALSAFMIVNRMPRLYDPVDEAAGMRRASRDGWVLCLRSEDERHRRASPRSADELRSGERRGGFAMKRARPCSLLRCSSSVGCDDMIHQVKMNAYADARVATRAGARRHSWVIIPGPMVPPPVTLALMERGQERFRIYCTPCHSELGDGHGMVVQRGFPAPPSYHIDRLREAPVQHFFDVITNGYGAMYSFAYRVQPADRWAIAAYIRALQRSQNAQRCGPHARAEGDPAMTRRPTSFALVVGLVALALAALGWVLDARRFHGRMARRGDPASVPGRSAALR